MEYSNVKSLDLPDSTHKTKHSNEDQIDLEKAELIAKTLISEKIEQAYDIVVTSVNKKEEDWIIKGSFIDGSINFPFNYEVRLNHHGGILFYNLNT